jgi:hypothetical protein
MQDVQWQGGRPEPAATAQDTRSRTLFQDCRLCLKPQPRVIRALPPQVSVADVWLLISQRLFTTVASLNPSIQVVNGAAHKVTLRLGHRRHQRGQETASLGCPVLVQLLALLIQATGAKLLQRRVKDLREVISGGGRSKEYHAHLSGVVIGKEVVGGIVRSSWGAANGLSREQRHMRVVVFLQQMQLEQRRGEGIAIVWVLDLEGQGQSSATRSKPPLTSGLYTSAVPASSGSSS